MDTEDQVIESEEQQPEEETAEPQEEVQEENVTEEVEEEEAPEEEEVPEPTPEPEEKPSRRESLRVRDLLSKYPKLETQPEAPKKSVPFRDMIEADEQVYGQLEETTQKYGEEQYNSGVKQIRKELQTSEWRTMLNIDAPTVEKQYGWLDPKNKAEFDPDLADVTNEEYKRFVGYDEETGLVSNPVRYSDFVEARVELANRMAEAMVQKSTKNIARQAAQTGLRPDGSKSKTVNLNKRPDQMSDEELALRIKKDLGL